MLHLKLTRTLPAPDPAPLTPEAGDPVNVDGYEGIITHVGHRLNASPIYGDDRLAVHVTGLTGEWDFWIYADTLIQTPSGWIRTTVTR